MSGEELIPSPPLILMLGTTADVKYFKVFGLRPPGSTVYAASAITLDATEYGCASREALLVTDAQNSKRPISASLAHRQFDRLPRRILCSALAGVSESCQPAL